MLTENKKLFELGQLVATPGAMESLQQNEQSAMEFLHRHQSGDRGDLCDEDKAANDEALADDLRILSAYRLEDGTRIWIITEADRSSTCCLLPNEY